MAMFTINWNAFEMMAKNAASRFFLVREILIIYFDRNMESQSDKEANFISIQWNDHNEMNLNASSIQFS